MNDLEFQIARTSECGRSLSLEFECFRPDPLALGFRVDGGPRQRITTVQRPLVSQILKTTPAQVCDVAMRVFSTGDERILIALAKEQFQGSLISRARKAAMERLVEMPFEKRALEAGQVKLSKHPLPGFELRLHDTVARLDFSPWDGNGKCTWRNPDGTPSRLPREATHRLATNAIDFIQAIEGFLTRFYCYQSEALFSELIAVSDDLACINRIRAEYYAKFSEGLVAAHNHESELARLQAANPAFGATRRYGMADESVLKSFGYNAQSGPNPLTRQRRRKCLQLSFESELSRENLDPQIDVQAWGLPKSVVRKERILSLLRHLMDVNGQRDANYRALEKWGDDYEWASVNLVPALEPWPYLGVNPSLRSVFRTFEGWDRLRSDAQSSPGFDDSDDDI
ncbi:MAG: hypothetical protein KIT68_09185 [Phycisphaeraceae bacterium]|nr:hypothetical protein [Phycisphaeraceae bacterium]